MVDKRVNGEQDDDESHLLRVHDDVLGTPKRRFRAIPRGSIDAHFTAQTDQYTAPTVSLARTVVGSTAEWR